MASPQGTGPVYDDREGVGCSLAAVALRTIRHFVAIQTNPQNAGALP
jgi:hypothetical protein